MPTSTKSTIKWRRCSGESSGQSSLAKLLKAWGLDMDINKVVADP